MIFNAIYGAEVREFEKYKNYFFVSDGSIWSNQKKWNQKVDTIKKLKGWNQDGYIAHGLLTEHGIIRRFAHQVIAEVFIGPCPKGMEVLHKDGTRNNNSVSNLRYGTRKDNCEDTVRHGRSTKWEKQNTAKLKLADIPKIYDMFENGMHIQEIADQLNVQRTNIYFILIGHTWVNAVPGRRPPLLDEKGNKIKSVVYRKERGFQ